MRSIRISNPVLDSYITDVSADYTSGTAISVRSNNSFSSNDLAVFGNPTEKLTELKKISSLTGVSALVLASTLNFQHNKGTPVYKSIWDFVSIEARVDGNGVFAEITSSPIQWDSKSNQTIYFHQAGTDTWQYRFRFYNSVTATYSEYSPTLTGAGFTHFQMGYIIKEARRVAGDRDGRVLSSEECLHVLTRCKNIIRAHNPRYWFWKVNGYMAAQINSSFAIPGLADTNVYSLAGITNLGVIDLIEYTYIQAPNTNQKWALRRKSDIEFLEFTRNQSRPRFDFPHFYRLLPPDANSAKGYFEIENKLINSGVGTFYVSYYQEESDYNSVDDTTAVIMPEIFQDYLISEIYRTKGNDAMADKFYELFTGPEARQKTLALKDMSGIALLDMLDAEYKKSQSQPGQLWRFRGQKAVQRLFGNRIINTPDYIRENYFNGPE